MVWALLYDSYMSTHLNNVSIDRLIVEVCNALVVYICLTCRCVCGNHTAIQKCVIICNCTSAECIGKEIFCKICVLAVCCDIQGRTAVTCVTFFTGVGRHGCDLPFTAVGFNCFDSRDDPVSIHNTSYLITLDRCICIIFPAVWKETDTFVYKLNDCIYNLNQCLIICDVWLPIFELGYAFSLKHHVYKVVTVTVHTHHVFAGCLFNIKGDLLEFIPGTSCQFINRMSCLLQKIYTVSTYNCTIIYRHTVMYTVDSGVVQFLC